MMIPWTVNEVPPGVFWAISRQHGDLQVPVRMEIDPASLPELPKPSRTPGNSQKPDFVYKK